MDTMTRSLERQAAMGDEGAGRALAAQRERCGPAMLKARVLTMVSTISDRAEADRAINFPNLDPETYEVTFSPKWAKVIRKYSGTGASVYCFVALTASVTKSLGRVKAGDIHKPASFKAPAKHARGSVFEENFGGCLTRYGIVYLR